MTKIAEGPHPVSVEIKYKLGHSYTSFYEISGWNCPNCKSEKVWVDQGDGDCYQGPTYYCVGCNCSFTMPSPPTEANDEDRQVIDAIRRTHYTV